MCLEHSMKVTNRQYATKSGQVDAARKKHNWMKQYMVDWDVEVLGNVPDSRSPPNHHDRSRSRRQSRRQSRSGPRSRSRRRSRSRSRNPSTEPHKISIEQLMAMKPSSRSHHVDDIRRHNLFCRTYFREINDFYAQKKIVRLRTYTLS